MSNAFRFERDKGLIVVHARIDGPSGRSFAALALDTGATSTMINTAKLVAIGYDPAAVQARMSVTTASGVESAVRLPVNTIVALGQERRNFAVLSHTLPPATSVDGVLGLDFFRGLELRIDFRQGLVSLS